MSVPRTVVNVQRQPHLVTLLAERRDHEDDLQQQEQVSPSVLTLSKDRTGSREGEEEC